MRHLVLSLFLVLGSCIGWSTPADDLLVHAKLAASRDEASRAVDLASAYLGNYLTKEAKDAIGTGQSKVASDDLQDLESVCIAANAAHSPVIGPVKDASAMTSAVLANHGFKDSVQTSPKNWTARGLDKLAKAILDWLEQLFRGNRAPDLPSLGFLGGPGLTYIMWGLIFLAVGALIIFAYTKFDWARLKKEKKAGGIADDEPDRTADEWLERADALAGKGDFREAVRCLYVASLIRIDEANVARFRKGETNWEHLKRIQASPKKPLSLDFRAPTQRFDIVWYGHRDEGIVDVNRFRGWYQATVGALGGSNE